MGKKVNSETRKKKKKVKYVRQLMDPFQRKYLVVVRYAGLPTDLQFWSRSPMICKYQRSQKLLIMMMMMMIKDYHIYKYIFFFFVMAGTHLFGRLPLKHKYFIFLSLLSSATFCSSSRNGAAKYSGKNNTWSANSTNRTRFKLNPVPSTSL